MLIPQPNKLQRPERFPSKYTVTALQQIEWVECRAATKNQSRQQKQQPAKLPPNQSTMDKYITKGNLQKTDLSDPPELSNADAMAFTEENFPSLKYDYPEVGLKPQGWD